MTRSLEPAVDRDSRPPVGLLAAGAGLTVAGIYYNQPILHTIATELHASPAEVGYVPMLTQLGYAAGIVLFAPIGDRFERRGVILLKSIALILALVGAAVAPSIVALCAASLLIGLFATIAQDFVPAAAAMAPDASRGKVVGTVMTGLLLGILLSRFVSGTAASQFGWRLVFAGAAVSIAALAVVARARLPAFPPTASESYGALLLSMIKLARELPALRRAALAQALLSVAFSGFWSTLALELATPA
ncbi:MAG TPA: MFS transporter, partial [Kofleriaceae bacterium]